MPHAHSSLVGIFGASFDDASFDVCTMLHTHSSFLSMTFASFNAASFDFDLRTVSPAHSSLLCMICTSFDAALFDLCTMFHADFSFDNLICAPISTAYLSILLSDNFYCSLLLAFCR